ncbi:Crp/Fnr family transcriptional regulator [Candidatus Venteria ishoeyi]|uniref:Crp/Fnr family transcriptional regulator n=1 Tax=Candidatus Venteria ishoeyi TaxID=1899563 RepID=UPI0025A66E2B|nr:Crp/Fnr family transcriptional regulator [Candidatus Venteria ishoeyi]MDM8546769.1 Crp/Fnr family transcriptional regulator [Candidatus Venteria ishoeyi]
MMSVQKTLTHLPFYTDLSQAGRESLLQGAKYNACAATEIILHKGQRVSGAYMVLNGRLRVYSISANGNEATLTWIEPGEICVFSLNCLFNNLLYPAWVATEQDTEVAMIPVALYRELFKHESSVQDLTVHSLSILVFRLMEELDQVHGLRHKERLANFLLVRASSSGTLNITQQQLAQHLGTSREVIARLLQNFVAKSYVRTGRGSITLLDTKGLSRVVTDK